MRVLFANETSGFQGGVEQNVFDVARHLSARGHDCSLAFGRRTGNDDESFAAAFREAIPVREMGATDGLPFLAALRRARPDVVFVHKPGDVLRVIADGIDTPSVMMVHDYDLTCPRRHKYLADGETICSRSAGWKCALDGAFVRRDPESMLGFSIDPIGPKLARLRDARQVDSVMVASRFMKEQLEVNGFDPERVRILPPVLPRATNEGVSRIPRDRHIVFVGQLIRGKGVDLLLDACSRLDGDWKLTIAGDGNARATLEAQANALGLARRVSFAGWVGHSSLGSLYRSARVVVVPSRWPEPFGMVGIEAMIAARPVVAFAVGGIPDWLEHERTGLLAAAGDTGALARAISRVLESDELATSLGEAGRSRAEAEFSFDRYLDGVETLLSHTVSLRRAA